MVRKPSVYPKSRLKDVMIGRPKSEPRYIGYEARFAEWATSQGWDVTKRGWPDFICRRDGALMAVEVKGGADELSPEQIDTLDDLSAAGLPTYVYHDGLGLKRWRRSKRDSVGNLKAEISELHELIRRIIQVRDGMVPGLDLPQVPDWTIQNEVDVVNGWCAEKHAGHKKIGTRMTGCGWVYYLHKQEGEPFDAIVPMVGGTVEHLRNLYRKAEGVVAAAMRSAAA